MASYKFTYPSKIESESKMYSDIIRILIENSVTGELRNQFKVVVSEAFNNAIIHGNRFDENKLVVLKVEVDENFLSAEISDEGRGGMDKVLNKKQSTFISESGRGIDLIKYYSNDYQYEELSNGGLKVSIKFNRKESKTIS